MDEREYLCGLCIRTVNENKRRQHVGKRKTTEFVGIERPVGVVSDNAADHYEDSGFLSGVYEPPKRRRSRHILLTISKRELKL